MDKQTEFVLRTLEERDIRFVRLWFTDVLGFLKSVAIAPAELEGAFAEGIGFDGSARLRQSAVRVAFLKTLKCRPSGALPAEITLVDRRRFLAQSVGCTHPAERGKGHRDGGDQGRKRHFRHSN